MIKHIVAVSVLALMRITYAENRLIPMMRACVGSSANMFRCEISNAADRVLHIERPFETGNTFVLKKIDLSPKDKIRPLGCNRRWRDGKPSAAYFVEVQPHAQCVFTFRREKWPEECVGWHKIVWILEDRFLGESWGAATNELTVCTGKTELPLVLYENEAGNGGILSVEFGDDSCDDALILIANDSSCNKSIAGEGGDTLGRLVFTLSSLAREISLPVSKIQNTTMVGECGLRQIRFQWTDIVKALGNCDRVLRGTLVDVQWFGGKRKSNVLPLWIEDATEGCSQSNSRKIPLKTLIDDTLK